MLHRPLRRPLAIVALLSLVDYVLWTLSRSASLDTLALVAGLTFTLLFITLLWLLVVGATRLLADATRRAPAARPAAGARVGRSRATTSQTGEQRAAAARSVRDRHASAAAGAGEAPVASPSSKLAA